MKWISFLSIMLISISINARWDMPEISDEYSSKKLYITPTVQLETKDWPKLRDNMNFEIMNDVISAQIKKFLRINISSQIQLGKNKYSAKSIPASLLAFQKYMFETIDCLAAAGSSLGKQDLCYSQFQSLIAENFDLYIPKDQIKNSGSLFTGYYTPTIPAERNPSDRTPWGIYQKPKERDLASLTRNQIDFEQKLINSPYTVGFSNDLFENYLLHIEGGGRLEFTNADGSKSYQYISYDGTNGQSFRFISKYMMEKSYIDNGSILSQRNFLEANPQLWEEIYATCPSYVYFKPTDHPPFGNDAVPLVNGRSIATDYKLYALKGLISFIHTPAPDRLDANGNVIVMPFSRFFVDHDTGGAIKGSARADIFFGEDKKAEFQASLMKYRGAMHFLALKKEKLDLWIKVFDKMKKHR